MNSGPSSPSTPPVPGYEIVRPLGRGAMGQVVLARQLRLGRPVAIKFLSMEGDTDPGPGAARFRREAELMARISHPNILAIYDSGEVDGRPYLVMEYVEGGDLRRLMRPGRPMPSSQVLPILAAVAEALTHLHRVGILHRDLKPENILMHDGDNPKVADFGLAVLRAGAGSITETREGIGTLGYVSPEQRYRLRVDERADQYSLAALAYELLTGECPVGIIRPPSGLNHRLPRGVDAVLLRALQEDPDDRYPTIPDFIGAMQSSLRPAAPLPVAPGRSRLPVAVAAAAVVLCGAGLIGFLWSSGGPPPAIGADRQAGWTTPGPDERPGPVAPAPSPFRSRLNAVGMRMVELPSGTFLMGASPGDQMALDDERPRRTVRIARPFWMAAHEVTVAQFRSFVDATGHVTVAETEGGNVWDSGRGEMRRDVGLNWRSPGYPSPPGDDHPVVQVAREDAEAFCRWLSAQDGRRYLLPTEAEWEYACRAGTATRWSMGDDPARLGDYSWYRANSAWALRPVGHRLPNPWGLFDMHGNAWELCSDWYGPYPQPRADDTPEVDPTGPQTGYRWVIRGGSWDSLESESQGRSSARSHKVFPYFTVGFRVCHDGQGDAVPPVALAPEAAEVP